LRDCLGFMYFYPFRGLAAILPSWMTSLISMPLVYIYSLLPVNQKGRKCLREMIGLIFSNQRTKGEVRKLSQQYLRNSIRSIMDDIILAKFSRKDLLKRGAIHGLENLENALLDNKGVILVGGHFSGDRVSKLFLRELGFPILSVRAKSPANVNPSMSIVEEQYFMPIKINILNRVLTDHVFIEDKGFGIEILKRLRSNGLVSVLIDGKARAKMQGIHCPFFGRERFFATNFLQIAHLTGAAIVPMVCIGNSSSFTVTFQKRIDLQYFPEKKDFIAANINKFSRMLESQIRQYPTHWLMM